MISQKKGREIERLYPTTSNKDISKIVGVPEWMISKFAQERGLEKDQDREVVMIDAIKKMYVSTSNESISQALNIHKSTVDYYGFSLGLRKPAGYFDDDSTPEENEISTGLASSFDPKKGNSRGNYMLFEMLSMMYPMYKIEKEHPIGGMRIDIFIKELRLGFEFQGVQHEKFNSFHFETKADFVKAQNRDYEKSRLCEISGISLIHIYYDEDLTFGLIRSKIREVL